MPISTILTKLELNIGWLHGYGIVCWALLRPILSVELCGPTISARITRSHRSPEQGLLRARFARTYIRLKRAFAWLAPSFVDPLTP